MFYKFLLIFANITGDTNDNNNDTSAENNKKMAELPKDLKKPKIALATNETNEPPEEDVITSFTGLKKKAKVNKKGQKEEEGVDVAKEVIELTFAAEVISLESF